MSTTTAAILALDASSAEKQCNVCGEVKPLDAFNKHSSTRDRRDNRCKDCRRKDRESKREHIKARNRNYYSANAERLRAYAQNYRESKPEVAAAYRERTREPRLAYAREWRQINQEKRRAYTKQHYQKVRTQRIAYSRAYREQHPGRARESSRAYRRNNPEKVREALRRYVDQNRVRYRMLWTQYRRRHPEQVKAGEQRRRAREALAPGSFTPAEWRAMCEHYGHRCLCCGVVKPLTPDHVIPLSKGGSNDIANIQPLCLDCNRRKGTKSTDYRTGGAQ